MPVLEAIVLGIVQGRNFLEAGGQDMLDGDGKLTYSPEKVLEAYYHLRIWKTVRIAADYQVVVNSAFNRFHMEL